MEHWHILPVTHYQAIDYMSHKKNKPYPILLFKTLLWATIVLSLSGTVVLSTTALAAPGMILDTVTVTKDVDKATTSLQLRLPIRYLGHFPESEGRVLKIRIQPLLRPPATSGLEESVSPSIDQCPILRDITLARGMGDDYTLTYRFRQTVRYQVVTQTDQQQLVVILLNPHSDEAGDPCNAGR